MQSVSSRDAVHRELEPLYAIPMNDDHGPYSSRSSAPRPRPPLINGHALYPQDSTDTLLGSSFERRVNELDSSRVKPDTTERLEDLRRLMIKDKLDY